MKHPLLFLLALLTAATGFSPRATAQTWSAVSSGVSGTVYPGVHRLFAYNGDLYVGGDFTTAGGISANRIAKWNGTTMSALGSGVSSGTTTIVISMEAYNGELYAGGDFGMAGGTAANNIAKWNGSSWSAAGTGITGPFNGGLDVGTMAVYNGELYAGGVFTTAGGVAANCIAKWNGTSWSAVGSGCNNRVTALKVYNGDLYAAGWFTVAGGTPASYIAKWNGTSWAAVGGGADGTIQALTVYNGELVAAGYFSVIGGVTANKLAKWNGTSWSVVGAGFNTTSQEVISALEVYNGELYAAGYFSSAGGVPVSNIARWNGSTWSPLGSGINDYAWDMEGYSNDLYVGGWFTTVGGIPATRLAKWNVCQNFSSAPASISGSASTCAGTSLTYSTPPVSGATSYLWNLPAGWTGTSSSNTINVTSSSSGGTITVAAVNACDTSSTQSLAVTVTAGPAANITASGITSFCQGGSVQLSANTGPGYSYQWSLNGSNIPGATNTSFVANQSGAYTVTITAGTCPTTSLAAQVTVHPLPAPVVTKTGLTLTTAPAQGTYQWYQNTAAIPGATNNSYTVTQNGSYYVTVTSIDNCSGQSGTVTITNVAVKGPKKKDLLVYPTQNTGIFSIVLPDSQQPSMVRIHNMQGAVVQSKVRNSSQQIMTVELDWKAPGVYYVELAYPDALYYASLIVN